MSENSWFTEMPSDNGEFLWLKYSSCGCCYDSLGIALVYDYQENNYPDFEYIDKNGVKRMIYWECPEPKINDNIVLVNAWRRFDSPTQSN